MAEGSRSGPLDLPALLRGELPSGDATRLFRAFARATLQVSSILTRVEVIAALPRGLPADWLDHHVRPARASSGAELFCWGDVLAALGTISSPSPTTERGYLTIAEAAAYLGYPSVSALRMALHRRQIVPSARRGRTPLFTRDDLDRQVRATKPHAETSTSPSENRHSQQQPRSSGAEHQARVNLSEKPQQRAKGEDPFGLRSVMRAALGEPARTGPEPDAGARARRRSARGKHR